MAKREPKPYRSSHYPEAAELARPPQPPLAQRSTREDHGVQLRDAVVDRLLHEARDRIDVVIRQHARARANWSEWAARGYPTSSTAATSLGSARHGNASDPVGDEVARSWGTDWQRQNQFFEEAVIAIETKARYAADLVTNATAHAQIPGADGCKLCDEVRQRPGEHQCSRECAEREHQHPEAWQPVYSRKAPRSIDVPDRPRCVFHYRYAERWGADAPPAITLFHLGHPGEYVPRTLVRDEHPEAYDQVQRQRRASA